VFAGRAFADVIGRNAAAAAEEPYRKSLRVI
jgi:hypothetical protein